VAIFNAKNKKQLPYPNKPFVPKVNRISLSYKASDTIVFDEKLSKTTKISDKNGEFLHISPFKIKELTASLSTYKQTLVSGFKQEGYIFLGLSGLMDRDTTISLFFDFLQSSTGVNINKDNLIWESFQSNRWVKLNKGNIILDNTLGFTKSGIIELLLPKVSSDELKNNEGRYWIRVSTINNSENYPKIKGIYINASEVICISDDSSIIGKEIPVGSIKKIAGKLPDVKKVIQPIASFGGIIEESEDLFYTSISERLRHKGRAVSAWDYERIILENFNNVRAVKCTKLDDSFTPVLGKIKVIVLNSKWNNSERHYFNGNTLNQMKKTLLEISSPFIDIEVMNPTVEYLLANCTVGFKPENNGGYYINLMNENISDFLSPTSGINKGFGGIGGSALPTMLISFLEELPFVESIIKLTVEHIVKKDSNQYSLNVYKDGEEIKTTTPWSVLSPVKEHNILCVIDKTQDINKQNVGLGNMQIGLDYILQSSTTECTKKQYEQDNAYTENKNIPQFDDAILLFKNK